MAFPAAGYARTTVEYRVGKGQESILVKLDKPGDSNAFTLSDPPRLVIDLPAQKELPLIGIPKSYKGRYFKDMRAAWFDRDTIRLVFTLKQPVWVSDKIAASRGKAFTVIVKPGETLIAPQKTPAKPAGPAPKKPEPAKEEKKPEHKELPVIVIDAGHGGHDPGAIGPKGTHEKDIVLGLARALQDALNDTGRYRAVLTRDDDQFILLRERIAIGRKLKGSIFISLHADSAPGVESRGLSVYTLSETASDAEAEALAAKENRVDVLSGMDLSEESPDVAGILISLAQRETNNNSAILADSLVAAMRNDKVRLLPNPHRFAGFAVLKAPDIPSVLVETGFISHPQEEKLLQDKKYRTRLINGLMRGIDKYFKLAGSNG